MPTTPGSPDGLVYLAAAIVVVGLAIGVNRILRRRGKKVSMQFVENWVVYLLLFLAIAAAVVMSL